MAVSLAASPFVDDPTASSKVGSSAASPTPAPNALVAEAPSEAAPEIAEPTATATASARATKQLVAAVLLRQAANGDGDSWKDTSGKEYRLGLVNTPEQNECGGATATDKRKALLANGFRATVYTTDSYGRAVSEIFTASGSNLNIYLARYGYANDKYLATYRSERPTLASQLDQAFAAAKAEKRGVWGSCTVSSTKPIAAPAQDSACHQDYVTCIPVKGDGSGAGDANDLDCGDIRKRVQLRQVGVDPYRLDNDGDGFGCDSYG